jgi:hypothetical protein
VQAELGHVISHIPVVVVWVADHLLTALTSAIFVSQAVAAAGIVTVARAASVIQLTVVLTVTSADFLMQIWV